MVVVTTIIVAIIFIVTLIPAFITIVKNLTRLAKVRWHKGVIDKAEKRRDEETLHDEMSNTTEEKEMDDENAV